MARKVRSSRGSKASPRQLDKPELQDVDRYLRAAGSWEQLRRQHEEWHRRRRPRGRPRMDDCDRLIDSILAAGGPKLRRPQIRAIADALWDWGWFVPLSEPVRATKPRGETPTVAPWDPRRLARDRVALTAQLETKLRGRRQTR